MCVSWETNIYKQTLLFTQYQVVIVFYQIFNVDTIVSVAGFCVIIIYISDLWISYGSPIPENIALYICAGGLMSNVILHNYFKHAIYCPLDKG